MLTRSSDITLEKLLAVPGIGAQVMSSLPIPDRVRLRRVSRTFLSAVDNSLLCLTELFREHIAGQYWQSVDTSWQSWLLARCPNLRWLSLASRLEGERPWQSSREVRFLCWGRREEFNWYVYDMVALEEVARCCHGLRFLDVAGCLGVKDQGLEALAATCRDLEGLDVSGCVYVGDAGISAVAESCHELAHIFMRDSFQITDVSLVSLGQHCPQLRTVDVHGTLRVSDVGVTALARGCSKLRCLDLTASNVTGAGLSQVAEHCHQLQELHCIGSSGSITDETIKAIAAGCPRLTQLSTRSCFSVTDQGMSALAKGCRGLRHLDLCEMDISDAVVSEIAAHCGQLEYLNLGERWNQKVTDASIEQVARNCTQLRHLTVGWCQSVTAASISRVAERCRGLQELSLSGHYASDGFDAIVRALATHCCQLRYLDVSYCRGIGGSSLAALVESCPELEYLDVCSLPDSTEVLKGLSHHGTKLRFLRAGGIRGNALSDADVVEFLTARGHQLEMLDLSCSEISDETIALVAQHCPRLRDLNVSGSNVTEKNLSLLAAGCRELQSVNAMDCERLAVDSLPYFRWKLRVSDFTFSSDEEGEEDEDEEADGRE
eukprot:jgi/Mesvir1/24550/Mv21887-RA.1